MHMMHDAWCMWSAVVCICSGILAHLPKRFSGQSPPPCQVAAVLAGCSLGTVDQTQFQKHMAGKRTTLLKQPKSAATKTRLQANHLQLNHSSEIMEQSTSSNGSWQDKGPKRKLERMRQRAVKREHHQNWQYENSERNTGCVLQLWRTRTLHLQLSHKAETHQHANCPAHWLESRG